MQLKENTGTTTFLAEMTKLFIVLAHTLEGCTIRSEASLLCVGNQCYIHNIHVGEGRPNLHTGLQC